LTQGENVHPCPQKKTKKRKFSIKDRKKAKEENSQSILEESKKRKKEKFPIKDRKKTKHTESSLDQTISEQYSQVNKKRKETTT